MKRKIIHIFSLLLFLNSFGQFNHSRVYSTFDNIPLTYHGNDLNEFEKNIFDRLPNIGKWQWSNYTRIWRGLEEADECLMEFVYHEANYLCQAPQAAPQVPDNTT